MPPYYWQFLSPITDHRSPITDYRLPITDFYVFPHPRLYAAALVAYSPYVARL